MEYWDREVIISIASKVDRVMRIDENYLSLKRGLYARACVEINRIKPLTPGINVAIEDDLDSFF